eukprot:6387411-Prorocentrum_lima.AAC.1
MLAAPVCRPSSLSWGALQVQKHVIERPGQLLLLMRVWLLRVEVKVTSDPLGRLAATLVSAGLPDGMENRGSVAGGE